MAEELENTSKSSGGRLWTIILVIVIVGFAAFAVKTFIDDRNRSNNTAEDTVSRDNIAQEFAPPVTQQPDESKPENKPTPDIRGPVSSVSNKPRVLGSEINTQTQPVYIPY